MATVDTFIDSARYDLRDYSTGLEFDDDEIVEYLNRMRLVLDSTLASMNSSQVKSTTTIIVTAPAVQIDASSVVNSGNWDTIREIWIGQSRLEKISFDTMRYKRKENSVVQTSGYALVVGSTYEILKRTTLDFTTTGAAANTVGTVWVCTVTGTLGTGDAVNVWSPSEPSYWAPAGIYVQFETATDATEVLDIDYNKKTAVLTTASNMPYGDIYNEIFRELLVMHAKAKKEGAIGPPEQTYTAMFRRATAENIIRTEFKPRYYKLDF